MTITETRTIKPFPDLYNLCVNNDWYTCGTNTEYFLMWRKANGNMTTEKMVALAEDIVEHTAPNCFKDCECNGISPLEYVLFELGKIANTFFDIH